MKCGSPEVKDPHGFEEIPKRWKLPDGLQVTMLRQEHPESSCAWGTNDDKRTVATAESFKSWFDSRLSPWNFPLLHNSLVRKI